MKSHEYKPNLASIGDKVKFFNEVKPYTIRALSNRYAVCTKPFNPQHTVLYTIIDFKEKIRGPEDLVFGMGAETDQECFEMLIRLLDGESEVTHRNRVRLDLEWIKNPTDNAFVYTHEHGEFTVNDVLEELT